MATGPPIEIRSYRAVFDLERRIYSVEGMRLNPAGIPLRGVLYCLALVLVSLLAQRIPLGGALLAVLPWYIRDLALPIALAALACVVRIEGRVFHVAAGSLVRFALSPRSLSGLSPYRSPGPRRRWCAPDLVFLCDGSEARLRRVRFTGPGAVLVGVAHELAVMGARAGAHQRGGSSRLGLHGHGGGRALRRARVLELGPRARLDVNAQRPPQAPPGARSSRAPGR